MPYIRGIGFASSEITGDLLMPARDALPVELITPEEREFSCSSVEPSPKVRDLVCISYGKVDVYPQCAQGGKASLVGHQPSENDTMLLFRARVHQCSRRIHDLGITDARDLDLVSCGLLGRGRKGQMDIRPLLHFPVECPHASRIAFADLLTLPSE